MICRDPSSTNCFGGTNAGPQLSYSTNGRLVGWQNTPANPTATAAFLYDAEGNRVEQQVTQNGATTTIVYLGNLEQDTISGSTTTKTTFYYAAGRRTATALNLAATPPGPISYLASDGLGTADDAVKASDGSTSSVLYVPYGAVRYSAGTMPADYGFTGQHADSTTGLDYYNARYYDPVAGQFASADSLLPGGGFDIFGLSRYAYVKGNPETWTDPLGHAARDEEATCATKNICPSNTGEASVAGPPDTQPWNPCSYGMGTGCNPQQGLRTGAYSVDPLFYADRQYCRADPACRQGSDDVAFIGMMFIPGPDALVAVFLVERGGVALRLFFRVFGRTGTKAVEKSSDLVNLASAERTEHILYGDGTGGGHLSPGRPGKTPFPASWSGDMIMHAASDIATDPAATIVAQQGTRTAMVGERGGIRILVVTDGKDIITAYPINIL